MGWLGWTEREAMRTDVNSIMIAMEGKMEMLYPEAIKIHQKENETPQGFANRFKSFAKQHNEGVKN